LNGDVPDRRSRPRLRLSYPLFLFRLGEASGIETRTEDISCEGFFCISESPFALHEMVECELVIPAGEPRNPTDRDLLMRCRAHVIRVVRQRSSGFGVACRLEDYTLRRVPAEPLLVPEYSTP
jgi:hypothetical protein